MVFFLYFTYFLKILNGCSFKFSNHKFVSNIDLNHEERKSKSQKVAQNISSLEITSKNCKIYKKQSKRRREFCCCFFKTN